MIDSTPSPAGAAGAKALPPELSQLPARRLGRIRDELSTAKADQVRAALQRDPEIRPEMVAKGRALAADPGYPPPAVIRQVAGLIVDSPDLSEDQS
jgi:hypothetical protein